MIIERRELNMIAVIVVLLIIFVGFMITKKKIPIIREVRGSIQTTESNIKVSKRLLEKVPELKLEQAKLSAKLPVYPFDEDVKTDLFSKIESIAGKSSLRLLKREAEGDEEQLGDADVYQFRIACTFEGTSESLLLFLFATQKQGALDVSYLKSEPNKRRSTEGIINGRFTVDCAYRRQKMVPKEDKPAALEVVPAPAASGVGETS